MEKSDPQIGQVAQNFREFTRPLMVFGLREGPSAPRSSFRRSVPRLPPDRVRFAAFRGLNRELP